MPEVTYKLTSWRMVRAYCKFHPEFNGEEDMGKCEAIKGKMDVCKQVKCPLWDVLETPPNTRPAPQLCALNAR